nr:MAG TPA: hypothetical protein [Caudoviricetes sp.]
MFFIGCVRHSRSKLHSALTGTMIQNLKVACKYTAVN